MEEVMNSKFCAPNSWVKVNVPFLLNEYFPDHSIMLAIRHTEQFSLFLL